ncbi:MAG: gliding motility-associated C-terminal domain-containing protein, partial [Bacteroidota bacterium]
IWSPNAPNGILDPNVVGSGTFLVEYTYTDANGCSNTATATATINPSPMASIGPFNTQICTNDDPIFLVGIPPGGQWGPLTPGGNLIPSNLGVGNWNATYTYTDANGCTATTTTPFLILPEPTATITNPGTLCETGAPVTLQASPQGGTWSLNAASGVFIPSNFPPGSYEVTYTYTAPTGCMTMATTNIIVESAPTVDILPPPPLCTSDGIFVLTAIPAGGTWGGDTPNGIIDPSALGTGQFTALYTYLAPSGCLVVDSESFTISGPPAVSIDPVGSLCVNSGALVLNATPAGGIWSTNAPNGVFDPSAFIPGNYTISYTYTDPTSGCSESADIDIQVVAEPTVSILGNTSFCAGASTILLTDGVFASYSWSNSSTANVITVSTPGIYTVTVTDASGCTATAQQSVTQSNQIMPTISGGTSICDGASTTLTVDGTYSSYAWSNQSANSSITVTSTGTYTVTVTDASGCTGTTDISVTANSNPTPTIMGESAFCPGQTAIIATGVYANYLWSENSTTQFITVGTAGTYTVTVTDANGCTGTADFQVSEQVVSPPDILGALDFCEGSSTTLTGSGGYSSYQWSNGSNINTTTVDQSGNITLTVVDANGCTTDNTVFITENNNPVPSITGVLDICVGGVTTLEVDNNFVSYQWSETSTTNSISVTEAGIFSVTVTDGNGCTGEDQVTVNVLPELQPTITGDTDFCNETSTTLDAGDNYASYIWSNAETTQTINPTETGSFTVTVTDGSGCTGSATISVTELAIPVPQISGSTSFCTGTSTTLEATGNWVSYQWSNNTNDPSIDVAIAGLYTVTVTDADGCTGTAAVDVTESSSLSPVIVGDLNYCPNGTTTLDAGLGFATYTWSNGENTQTIEVMETGDFTVTVSDASGCTGEQTVFVEESVPPSPTITGQSSFCTGASSLLDAGVGFTDYLWSDGSTNQTLTVIESGTFTVTITDGNGCIGTTSIEVEELASLNPGISGNNEFCTGNSTTIAAASGFASYLWSDNSTTDSLVITAAGTYSVTVTDNNGCTGEQSYSVSENNNPLPTISGDLEFCPNTSTVITAETGFTNYLWSDNSTDENLEVTAAGNYTVTVTDNNGCTGATEVTVETLTSPVTTITGAATFCPNESTDLDAGGNFSEYLWSNNATEQTINVDLAGLYTVTITDTNGCTGTDVIEVSENIPPVPVIVGATSFCSGNATALNVSGNFTDYLWSDNSTDTFINVNQSGNYTVTVTDDNGCTGTSTVQVQELSTLLPMISGNTNFCPNESTLIQAETGYDTYAWSNGTSDPNITITSAGIYTVTVSDVNGCTGTNAVEIFENVTPEPTIAGSTTFCTGFSTTLDVGSSYVSYVWSDNSTEPTLEVNTNGTFAVTVTDANGCTGVTSVEVSESNQLQPVISGDDEFCSGTSTVLDAGSGFTAYTWSNNTFGQTLEVNTAGTFTVVVTDQSGCTGSTSILVTENIPVDAGTANAATNLCSVDFTTINLQNELMGADDNGVWSETSAIPSVGNGFDPILGVFNTDGQLPGTYTFEYFLAGTGACPDDTETVTITIDETPEAIIAPTSILTCDFPAFELDGDNSVGNAGLTYAWTTLDGNIQSGAATSTPTIDAPGTYELTVALPNGCFSTADVTVNQDIATPDVNTGMDQQLTCTNGEATLAVTSNTPNVIFTWFGPGITAMNMNEANPVVTSAGNYSVVATNTSNGCESSVATVNVAANIDAPTFTLDPVGALDCNTGAQVLIGPTATNYAYQWSLNGNPIAGATDAAYEATQAGTYALQVTNTDNGCNTVDMIEVIEFVDPPLADAGTADLLTCSLGAVTLSGSGNAPFNNITYQWLDQNNNPIPNSNTTSVEVTQPGIYTLIVTDNTNGCTATDQVTVQADNNFPVAEAGPDLILDCDFNDVLLGSANPPTNYSYQWIATTGGFIANPTIPNPTVNQPGTYQLVVTDNSNGCTATDEVVISENTNLPTAFEIEQTEISCNGENDGLLNVLGTQGGTPPYEYTFDGSSFMGTTTFSFIGAGSYSLSVMDALGCELQTEVTFLDPPPFILNLGPDITIELGDEAQIQGQANSPYDSIWWNPHSSLPCDDCPNPVVSPTETTTYSASAINFNNCIDTDDLTVFVEKNRNVFIPNVFSPNDDGFNDVFYIFGGDDVEKIRTFRIYNRWGEQIFELNDFFPNDDTKGWDGFFKGKRMNPAVFVYFAEIEFKDGLVRIYKGDVALRR